MNRKAAEVIHVGGSESSVARILRVTQLRVAYIDAMGEEQSIDLENCAKIWGRWYDEHSQEFVPLGESKVEVDAWNSRCVGERGALDHPPWVQFMNDRNTRFEFENYEALYRELLGPLMQRGWHTFDTD